MRCRERLDQGFGIDDEIRQAVHRAAPAQERRNFAGGGGFGLAGDRLAAEERLDPSAHALARPEQEIRAEQLAGGKIDLAAAFDAFAPAPRHVGGGPARAADRAMQGVLQATVDDALGLDRLPAPELAVFQQNRAVARPREPVQQPQPGHAAAEDHDVG